MNLTVLQNFIHVARLGSFTRAAQVLHIAQPALTKQIQRLEESLGTTIFERTSRKVKLTEAGRTLLQHSQQILSEWGQVQRTLQEVRHLEKGHCRLAVFPTFLMFMAPNFLVDFSLQYPNLDLEIEQSIQESTNETLIQWVLRHQFEAGIVVIPVGHPKLAEYPLYIEESVIIVSKGHELYGHREIMASELSRYPVIITSLNTSYRTFLSAVFRNIDVQLQVRHIVHHYPLVFQMVRSNLGAGIVPTLALRHLSKDGDQFSVIRVNPPLQRTMGWIEHRGVKRNPALEAFFGFMTRYLRSQDLVASLIDTGNDRAEAGSQ